MQIEIHVEDDIQLDHIQEMDCRDVANPAHAYRASRRRPNGFDRDVASNRSLYIRRDPADQRLSPTSGRARFSGSYDLASTFP